MLTSLLVAFSIAHAEDNPVGEGKGAKVQVETTKPGVTVTVVYDESTSTVATSYGTGAIYNFKKHEVCQAPCEFEITPGMRGVVFTGDKYNTAGGRYDLREGTSVFHLQPGSKGLASAGGWLVVLGSTALVTFGSLWGADAMVSSSSGQDGIFPWAGPATGVSALVTAAGIPMIVFSKSKVEFTMAK